MLLRDDDESRKAMYAAMIDRGTVEVLRRELEDATCEDVAQRVFAAMLSAALIMEPDVSVADLARLALK